MEREHYTYTMDFSGLKDWREIYPLVRKCMEFPEYMGNNLDAIWDCLTDYICYQNTITIKGVKSLSKSLQEDVTEIIDLFREAEEKYPDRFEIRYED